MVDKGAVHRNRYRSLGGWRVTPGDREALEALQRRLEHAEAIAELIAEPLDTNVGTALHGIASMLADMGCQLEAIIAHHRKPSV